jgi:membrane-bound serine protease (ClpP class)
MTALIIALLVIGAALLVAEAHLPAYGALGAAGVAALVVSVVLAVSASGGSALLAAAIAAPIGIATGGVLTVAVRKGFEVRSRRVRCGSQGLIGHVGVVRRPLEPLGQVYVDGELWRAERSWAEEDEVPPGRGEPVVVERVHGLTLSVRRAEEWEVHP